MYCTHKGYANTTTEGVSVVGGASPLLSAVSVSVSLCPDSCKQQKHTFTFISGHIDTVYTNSIVSYDTHGIGGI